MSLIDHERSSEIVGIDLVGAEKIEQFDIARSAPGKDAADVIATRSRHEPNIEPADAGCCMMQDVEPVPLLAAEAATVGDITGHRQHSRPIGSRERSLSEH